MNDGDDVGAGGIQSVDHQSVRPRSPTQQEEVKERLLIEDAVAAPDAAALEQELSA